MAKLTKYVINQLGAKILLHSTQSYLTFIEESGQLEFFLMYILMAEHSDTEEFKKDLAEQHGNEDNPASKKLVEFLNSQESDILFDPDTYELYFSQMAFTRLTDNALSYFKEILSEVVRKKPEILKSSEKESLDYILSFNSMDELINDLTEKKVKKLFYGSITDIKKFFRSRLGIELFDDKQSEEDFNQLTQQRNLIVHNRGIITQELAEEFNYPENLIGEKLHFKFQQLSNINKIINNIIVEIDIKLSDKFDLEMFPIE